MSVLDKYLQQLRDKRIAKGQSERERHQRWRNWKDGKR